MAVGRDSNAIEIGAGSLFIAPIGTAEPVSLTGALDAAFVDLGYTDKGHIFTNTLTAADVVVAEEYYPLKTIVTAKTATWALELAQFTAKNLQVAYAGGTITNNGSYWTFEPPLAGTETRVMLLWQSISGDARVLGRQCFQSGTTATSFTKELPEALLPGSFSLEKPTGKLPWIAYGAIARLGS